MEPKSEVAKIEPITMSPIEVILSAVDKGVDATALEKIEKLLEFQERFEAKEAKKAYNADMVEAQRAIPTVAKTLKNSQTHSRYASLDAIISQTKEAYTAHGFSISFYEGITEKPEHIRICADVIHCQGHKETYFYDAPNEGKGLKGNANMTPTHAKASSVSYARRYLMCMIWNIPTGDDNDGNGAGNNGNDVELIDENKLKIINDLLTKSKADGPEFLKYMGIEKLEDMPKTSFIKAKIALEAKLKNANN